MYDTQAFFGRPAMFPTTLFHDFPPSRVICTLPSSVPAQITFAFLGDSEMA